MALTGFNPQLVKKSINSVINAYNDLYDALIVVTQSAFVNPMATLWCCNESKKFFSEVFKPAMDSLQDGATKTFTSIVDSMNSAAKAWADRTGNSGDWSNVSFNPRTTKIDISGIRDKNANGEIGIDEAQSKVKAALLVSKTYVKATAALAKASAAVAVCGFLGGSQASSLQSSLKSIGKAAGDTTKELADGVKKAIESSADAYKGVGSTITNKFGGN